MSADGDEVRICEPGGKGVVLPLSEWEQEWPDTLRGFLYGIAMIYCFLGVSIIADIFMSAIEAVTSRRMQVKTSSGRIVTVRVWNETVSNLTLMALGSSAPEILLSVIELLKNKMYSGDLGPSTIVGSAAFNLLVIVALCIVIIPSSEVRKVRDVPVFIITVGFSLFAYIWLVIILVLITPDVIDLWEAVLTFLCFPALIITSWVADRGAFGDWTGENVASKGEENEEHIKRICDLAGSYDETTVETIKKALASKDARFRLQDGNKEEIEAVQREVANEIIRERGKKKNGQKKSRASRRIEATRVFTGGPKTTKERPGNSDAGKVVTAEKEASSAVVSGESPDFYQVNFVTERQPLSKELKGKPVLIARTGDASFEISVEYSVHLAPAESEVEGRSGANADESENAGEVNDRPAPMQLGPEVSSDLVSFAADETQKIIWVSRPVGVGPHEPFMVALRNAEFVKARDTLSPLPTLELGPISASKVEPALRGSQGKLAFAAERKSIKGPVEKQVWQFAVLRLDGCSGTVSCKYRTERMSAVPDYDYIEAVGTLEFQEGITEQLIDIEIEPKGIHQGSVTFLIVLEEPEGGAEFDPNDDGGEESSICTVTIEQTAIPTCRSGQMLQYVDSKILNFNQLKLGTMDWADQFVQAVVCNGSIEEMREATKMDWCFHIVSLPWKLLFSLVPPPSYGRGWVCFYASLFAIGVVTAIIGDLAELFGCVFSVPDAVTAITFVALGTSMPDLFASQTAAMQDPTADASIVNVTGSNSVNVFLGLGLPWTMGAVHWGITARDEEWESRYPDVAAAMPSGNVFVVPSGDLGFSVFIFAMNSLSALVLLCLRRRGLGAELGGPTAAKVSTGMAFVTLWLSYILMSSWRMLRGDSSSTLEVVMLIGIVFFVQLIAFVVAVFFSLKYWGWRPRAVAQAALECGFAQDTECDEGISRQCSPPEENSDCYAAGMSKPYNNPDNIRLPVEVRQEEVRSLLESPDAAAGPTTPLDTLKGVAPVDAVAVTAVVTQVAQPSPRLVETTSPPVQPMQTPGVDSLLTPPCAVATVVEEDALQAAAAAAVAHTTAANAAAAAAAANAFARSTTTSSTDGAVSKQSTHIAQLPHVTRDAVLKGRHDRSRGSSPPEAQRIAQSPKQSCARGRAGSPPPQVKGKMRL